MARYFDETILRIRAAAPIASIVILGPLDLGTREGGKPCDKRKPDAPMIPECEWRTPHVLAEIISVQHAAAVRNRAAFFDTFAAMGGADHMHAWVLAEPKLAYKDHVHLSDLGYQAWADALSSAVLAEYARWRLAQHLPPTRPLDPPPPRAPVGCRATRRGVAVAGPATTPAVAADAILRVMLVSGRRYSLARAELLDRRRVRHTRGLHRVVRRQTTARARRDARVDMDTHMRVRSPIFRRARADLAR